VQDEANLARRPRSSDAPGQRWRYAALAETTGGRDREKELIAPWR